MQRVIFIYLLGIVQVFAIREFRAEIKGPRDSIERARAQLDGHIVKGNQICQGPWLAVEKSDWQCAATAPKESSCSRIFQCLRIKADRTRLIQRRKFPLYKNSHQLLKKYQVHLGGRKIKFVTRTRKKLIKKINLSKNSQNVQEEELLTDQNKTQLRKVKTKFKSFEQLESGDSEESLFDREEAVLSEKEVDQEELKELLGEKEYQEVTSTNDQVKKKKKKKWVRDPNYAVKLLGVSLSAISTASNRGGAAQSIDMAWSPLFRLGQKWSARGHLGVHSIKTFVEGSNAEETFSVMDFAILAEYHLTGPLYLDGGMGFQQWSSTVGGTYTTFNFGGIYRFQKPILYLVDMIHLQYTRVSNSASNQELRFGLRTYF